MDECKKSQINIYPKMENSGRHLPEFFFFIFIIICPPQTNAQGKTTGNIYRAALQNELYGDFTKSFFLQKPHKIKKSPWSLLARAFYLFFLFFFFLTFQLIFFLRFILYFRLNFFFRFLLFFQFPFFFYFRNYNIVTILI